MNQDNKLILEGVVGDWKVYRNADGFMEGYLAIGRGKKENHTNSDVSRVVSNQTTLGGFEKYVKGLKNKTSVKDKPLKPSQLPPLPFPE